ncbi:tyrosine-type recombinase/integrase [Ralstonia solanacearum]|uniref:tyrosine-type recombinase/integrase n=1 Tax=Ralstonia solanacearum TaxID=305 RepID=UPI00168B599D|nr:integrase arm-type DNA-binding domain-containing protein [Ralstonia solanacearum]QNT25538.1 tyrosine-type recombinase/integrase [Ralstonia solanacearum]QNT63179.1 tyrosine-type recombinase/integrase [Ralstonia solanacearum]
MDNISRALTDVAVRKAKPADKPFKLSDGGGMHLLVKPNGAKLWRYAFRLHGKEGVYAIGQYPDVSLAAARNAHRAARELVAAGTNPVHTRKAEREQAAQAQLRANLGEFSTVVEGWQEANNPRLAAASIRQRDREIGKYLLPAFKGRAIDGITRLEIAPLLKGVEKRAPEVARNLRTYLFYIFEHAIDHGVVTGNPVPPPRAMRRRAPTSHEAMDTDRIPSFLAALAASSANPETKTALRMVMLTACRKNEVAAARWAEFDLDAGTWTIPEQRMKSRREHWVPLSRQVLALLRELRKISDGEVLFPHRDKPGATLNDRTLNALLERIGYAGESLHGWRVAFSTHFNGLGANPDVVEACLAHARRGVRGVYNRAEYRDERRVILQDWADHLDGLAAVRDDTAMAA